jgi:uncharacterized membrane protein YphA (DoxX/SURF4 family)
MPDLRRRCILNQSRFTIGAATVVLLVLLRLALGWHFLYEGVWKVKHPDAFAAEAEGFLTAARGPARTLFYAMVPDIEGRMRLSGGTVEVEIIPDDPPPAPDAKPADAKAETPKAAKVKAAKPKAEKAKPAAKEKKKGGKETIIENAERTAAWEGLRDRFVAAHPSQEADAKAVCRKHLQTVGEYLADNQAEIAAYLAALDRFHETEQKGPKTAFQEKRNWDAMQKLRGEAKVWLAELDTREKLYKLALTRLAKNDKAAEVPRPPLTAGWNPLHWTRIEQLSFAITWALTAIGLCLMTGFCTRLSALGGGVFMLMVVLSQPAYPGVIPPDPPQLGHALLVNKDFIEMLALFLVATTAVGRWGGLDYFLSKLCCRCNKKTVAEGSQP